MIKLQTPVTDNPCKVRISYKDKIMMLGSCFSDNIGIQLKNLGFDVCINPFGTLYNPASIMSSVRRLMERKPFADYDCMTIGAGDERICSFCHHTSFARADRESFLQNANSAMEEAAEFFKACSKVIITLGTSWCFRHLEKDIIVSNCLKRNPNEFRRELLEVGQAAEMLSAIMEMCPDKEFIFTVSPIRHFKDGAHGNQISKATLHLAIEHAIAGRNADYFPSYEIMMDELRDYRFYSEDMCHPSQQAAGYICDRFLNWALPEEEMETRKEKAKAFRHGCHRSGIQ